MPSVAAALYGAVTRREIVVHPTRAVRALALDVLASTATDLAAHSFAEVLIMAVPNGGESGQRRVGWWGWNREYGWDDQGCLGCGLAWWIVVLCCFVIFGFWGWGVPGWGGWAGWGWRHNVNNQGYNCQCPGQTGTTNMQPGSGQVGPAQPGVGSTPTRDGGSTAPSP